MDWKWLFIYPQQQIATVNYLQFPENTPLNFEVTSDAPMNSFWIPQLGGQIYAMPGMSTELHLMASQTGSFRGLSANISGTGFAGMDFVAKATTASAFNQWATNIRQAGNLLALARYNISLNKPSYNNPPAYYDLGDQALYNEIVSKYMTVSPDGQMTGMSGMTMPEASPMMGEGIR
jgi:cytochrome o ubiquinol oxidase subunit 2